jgi:ABC-2 type transport system permease protein
VRFERPRAHRPESDPGRSRRLGTASIRQIPVGEPRPVPSLDRRSSYDSYVTTISLRSRPTGFASGRTTPTIAERFARVYQYRRILKLLVKRDLRVRYAGSILGYVWTVLDPLLMSLVYWVVFTKLVKRNIGFSPYILFLVSGQLLWAWFNGAVSATAKALRSEAQMVRSSNVPRELWIVRSICSKGLEYIYSLPVLVIFALAYTKAPHWQVVLLPLAWLMMLVLLLGIGLIIAPLSVLVRDIDRVIPIFLRVMFYSSPVLFSLEFVLANRPQLRYFFDFNPVVGPLLLSRATFFPEELHWSYVWHSAIGTLLVFAIGLFTFARLERQVLKEI